MSSVEIAQTSRTPLEWLRNHRVAISAVTGILALKGAAENQHENTAHARELDPKPSAALGIYTEATPELPTWAGNEPTQENLDAFGAQQLEATPGFNIDSRQRTINVVPIEETLVTNFECPTPNNPRRAEVESIQVLPGNKANVTFCESEESVTVFTPDMDDLNTQRLVDEFINDPLRNQPWGIDIYQRESNVYYECPELPENQNPRLKFRYDDDGNFIAVSFDVGDISPYCGTELGQYTDRLSARAKRPWQKKWRKVGRSVLGVETTNGALAARYGAPDTILRETARITETGELCRPGRKLDIQIIMRQGFKPNNTRPKVHDSKGGTKPLKSGSATYKKTRRFKCPPR